MALISQVPKQFDNFFNQKKKLFLLLDFFRSFRLAQEYKILKINPLSCRFFFVQRKLNTNFFFDIFVVVLFRWARTYYYRPLSSNFTLFVDTVTDIIWNISWRSGIQWPIFIFGDSSSLFVPIYSIFEVIDFEKFY